jgi:hypothetical protein
MQLLPRLKKLVLERCHKLSALPPQLGLEAIRMKELQLGHVHNLKVVENLYLLPEVLVIIDCQGLERVLNLSQVRELCVPQVYG